MASNRDEGVTFPLFGGQIVMDRPRPPRVQHTGSPGDPED